eukprot:11124866-Ditylum_brightwellii.AAC.1
MKQGKCQPFLLFSKTHVDLYTHRGLPSDLAATSNRHIQHATTLPMAGYGSTALIDELSHCRQCGYMGCDVKVIGC